MTSDSEEVKSVQSEENEIQTDTVLKKKSAVTENDENAKSEVSKDSQEDEKMSEANSSEENDKNLQNEVSPSKKNKKKVKNQKRKSMIDEEEEDEDEKKAVQSPSKKKKKVSKSIKEEESETEVEKNSEGGEELQKDELKTEAEENSEGGEELQKDEIKTEVEENSEGGEEVQKDKLKTEAEENSEGGEEVQKDEIKTEVEENSEDEENPTSSGVDTITKREDWTGYFEKRDHSVNQVYQSEVPQICKDEPCQLGVDEAGRGPVLGPMVYGISYAPLSQKKLLVDMGCADSKSLTEEKRDLIFDKICKNSEKMGYAIDAISPNYIANCMYRRTKTSLNEVSMNSAIDLIKKTIEAGVFVTEIYVDTVGKPEKYQLKLELIFPGIKIVVAKKADSTYPIVSAASICAKVSRDHALRAWQFREGDNETAYGSGYPNDPATKSWLADNVDPIFGFPQIVRFSWSTAEKILDSKAFTVEWEDPEEDSPAAKATGNISSFFSASPASSKKNERKRNKFFTSRCLTSATTL